MGERTPEHSAEAIESAFDYRLALRRMLEENTSDLHWGNLNQDVRS